MVAITAKVCDMLYGISVTSVSMHGIKIGLWLIADLQPVPYFGEAPCSLLAAGWHLLSHLPGGILQEMSTDLSALPEPQVASEAVNTKN